VLMCVWSLGWAVCVFCFVCLSAHATVQWRDGPTFVSPTTKPFFQKQGQGWGEGEGEEEEEDIESATGTMTGASEYEEDDEGYESEEEYPLTAEMAKARGGVVAGKRRGGRETDSEEDEVGVCVCVFCVDGVPGRRDPKD
jgi:hypothetical protein